eukprot:2532215-Pleurochrysis_carterae.AAC.1
MANGVGCNGAATAAKVEESLSAERGCREANELYAGKNSFRRWCDVLEAALDRGKVLAGGILCKHSHLEEAIRGSEVVVLLDALDA